jgi:KTSC domain
MAIHRAQLNSSAISSAAYDDETQVLTVTFTSGRSYDHPGVPFDIYEGLAESPSPGRYWNTEIKGIYG